MLFWINSFWGQANKNLCFSRESIRNPLIKLQTSCHSVAITWCSITNCHFESHESVKDFWSSVCFAYTMKNMFFLKLFFRLLGFDKKSFPASHKASIPFDTSNTTYNINYVCFPISRRKSHPEKIPSCGSCSERARFLATFALKLSNQLK